MFLRGWDPEIGVELILPDSRLLSTSKPVCCVAGNNFPWSFNFYAWWVGEYDVVGSAGSAGSTALALRALVTRCKLGWLPQVLEVAELDLLHQHVPRRHGAHQRG